jgi:hypothetical protein
LKLLRQEILLLRIRYAIVNSKVKIKNSKTAAL